MNSPGFFAHSNPIYRGRNVCFEETPGLTPKSDRRDSDGKEGDMCAVVWRSQRMFV